MEEGGLSWGPSARKRYQWHLFSEVGWELAVRGPVGPFSLETVHWTVSRALEPTPGQEKNE
jgi:hypothetical protein